MSRKLDTLKTALFQESLALRAMGSHALRTLRAMCALASSTALAPLPLASLSMMTTPAAIALLANATVMREALAADSIQLETRQTHSRFIFNIDPFVPAELKPTKTGFELLFKGVHLGDLGAPLGEEASWKAQFEKLKDNRLEGLKITETDSDVKIVGKWKFPTGANALAEPKMEYFDYRDQDHAGAGKYILDFWIKKGPTLAEATVARKQNERFKTLKAAEEGARSRAERRIAMEKLKDQTLDTTRFCREPMNEKNEIFLPFLPVHDSVDFTKWLSPAAPDANYTYYEPKGSEKDAQYLRLALKLYRKNNLALTIRTLDFLDAEFPQNSFVQEARFLRANALLKLGLKSEAERLLSFIVAEGKRTPAALYTVMYLAANDLAKQSPLAALERFLWLAENHADHRLAWVFHLGAAETLFSLRQTERAAKEYQWIVDNAPKASVRAEAALKIGNLYMSRFQYEQALAAYFQGITHFPEESKAYPTAFINRAEALYGLGQYDRAEDALQAFLKSYPSHPAGWRATLRLGEISGRKEATAANQASSRRWYYETINHYPMSPGATLARLRLLPCADHGGMSLDTAKRFFEGEAAQFAAKNEGRGEIILARFRDLKSLARFRTMISLGSEKIAVAVAVEELRGIAASPGRQMIEALLGSLFRKSILTYLAEGRKYEALKFFHEKAEFIPKDKRLLDSDFILRLSQAASDLHLGQLAVQLNDTYKDAKAKAESDPELRAKKPPMAPEDLDSILIVSEESYTEAKALWVRGLEEGGRGADLGKIRALLAKVSDESPFSYEREIILGLADEREGKLDRALAHAIQAQILMPDAKARGRDLRIEGWLASLQSRAGDQGVALSMFRNLEAVLAKREQEAPSVASSGARSEASAPEILGVPPAPDLGQMMLSQGEILEKSRQWGQASAVYGRAMEKGLGGTKAMYGYANALLESGTNREKAIETLQKLGAEERRPAEAGSETPAERKARLQKEDFWRQLARERLANEKSKSELKGSRGN